MSDKDDAVLRGGFMTRHRRVLIVLGLVGAFGGAGVALAASGGLSNGDAVSSTARLSSGGVIADQGVLASGTSPVGGPWELIAYESDQSESQPAGLPCIKLILANPPKGSPVAGTGFCGELDEGFGAVSLPMVSAAGTAELLIVGVAPDTSTAVVLNSDRGAAVRASTYDVGAALGGSNVFVLAAGGDRNTGSVIALDGDGHTVGKALDAAGFFDRLRAVQQIAKE